MSLARALFLIAYLPWLSSVQAAPAKQLGQSRYYLIDGTLHYLSDGETPLIKADVATFVPHIPCPHPYRYDVQLAADKNAFYLYGRSLSFPSAHRAKVVACLSHGTCKQLVTQKGKLYRVNERAVELVAPVDEGFRALSTGNDAISPGYYRDKNRVYFYDVQKNTLSLLKGVLPEQFKAHAARYSFSLYWGRDHQRVFLGQQQLDGADALSFEYLGWVYAKDSRQVYCLSSSEPPGWFVMPGADPGSFAVVKGRDLDARDKNSSICTLQKSLQSSPGTRQASASRHARLRRAALLRALETHSPPVTRGSRSSRHTPELGGS